MFGTIYSNEILGGGDSACPTPEQKMAFGADSTSVISGKEFKIGASPTWLSSDVHKTGQGLSTHTSTACITAEPTNTWPCFYFGVPLADSPCAKEDP